MRGEIYNTRASGKEKWWGKDCERGSSYLRWPTWLILERKEEKKKHILTYRANNLIYFDRSGKLIYYILYKQIHSSLCLEFLVPRVQLYHQSSITEDKRRICMRKTRSDDNVICQTDNSLYYYFWEIIISEWRLWRKLQTGDELLVWEIFWWDWYGHNGKRNKREKTSRRRRREVVKGSYARTRTRVRKRQKTRHTDGETERERFRERER